MGPIRQDVEQYDPDRLRFDGCKSCDFTIAYTARLNAGGENLRPSPSHLHLQSILRCLSKFKEQQDVRAADGRYAPERCETCYEAMDDHIDKVVKWLRETDNWGFCLSCMKAGVEQGRRSSCRIAHWRRP